MPTIQLHDLTPAERRILNILPTHHSKTNPNCQKISNTLSISRPYTSSCLNRLFNYNLATYETINRFRIWHRIPDTIKPVVEIKPSRTLDDTMSDLQTMAQNCTKYQSALHAIANILIESGIHLPEITPPSEQ